jgi:predicted GNAT family acetyltransferase
MDLELRRCADVGEFYRRAEAFLAAHEAENNLPIGICTTRVAQPERTERDIYLATVERNGEIAAAAVRTPPLNVVLSVVPERQLADPVMALLVDDLRAAYADRVPGVTGRSVESRTFATRWQRETGQASRPGMKQRIYQLEQVVPPAGVPGALRRATAADRDLLVRWLDAFNRETHAPGNTDPEAWVDQMLSSPARAVYFWVEDGEPVTLVGRGGPTPHGARIGPVYTPPEKRRRGYASAGTAAVSQLVLDSGHRFCFLFTDLDNPTSNHIYQTIGYRPVCDVDVYAFETMPLETREL